MSASQDKSYKAERPCILRTGSRPPLLCRGSLAVPVASGSRALPIAHRKVARPALWWHNYAGSLDKDARLRKLVARKNPASFRCGPRSLVSRVLSSKPSRRSPAVDWSKKLPNPS